MKTRQQLLIETHALRQQAVELTAALEVSQRELDELLSAEQRQDVMRAVAGRSALERALSETRRMLDALDRALEQARQLPDANRIPASVNDSVEVSIGGDGVDASPVLARIGVRVGGSASRAVR